MNREVDDCSVDICENVYEEIQVELEVAEGYHLNKVSVTDVH